MVNLGSGIMQELGVITYLFPQQSRGHRYHSLPCEFNLYLKRHA
jgi:hypothetical protein